MRALVCGFSLLALPVTAMADTFIARADIVSAVVYTNMAEITRRLIIDLPAGQHDVLVPTRDITDLSGLNVTASEGVFIGPATQTPQITITEGQLDTPEQAAARDVVDQAQAALVAAQDRLALLDRDIAALDLQLSYLANMARPPEGAAIPNTPDDLIALVAALGGQSADIGTRMQNLQTARRAIQDDIEQATRDLETANQALADLTPYRSAAQQGLRIPVVLEAPTQAVFDISYIMFQAGWAPSYGVYLNSETGGLDIERSIAIRQYSPENWVDIDLTLSTANPLRQRQPQSASPQPARIISQQPRTITDRGIAQNDMPLAPSRPEIMTAPVVAMQQNGLSVTYDYPNRVTVRAEQDSILPFDTLQTRVDLENRAMPRHDRTAFLVAQFTNDTGEPILDGDAQFYRDGDFVGQGRLPLVAMGAETDLAFGPLDHLQLHWQDLSRNQGDRGLFSSSTEQTRIIVFGAENTSDRPETLRLIYETPFSEQDDLGIDVDLSRRPDARDIDGLRGVYAWDITLAPSEQAEIEMNVELNWPEDQTLIWTP